MTRSPEQTTRWVAGKIIRMGVRRVEVIGPHTIRIIRHTQAPFVACIFSTALVTSDILQPLLAADPAIEIAVNIPKEAVWTGEAIDEATSRHVAFGGLSDLMSAVYNGIENVREYVRSEYGFVEQGLIQHDRVSGLNREFDRVYLVSRYQLPPLRVVFLNEYELTADHIRTARSRYGRFDLILVTNPNGKPTLNALELAKDMRVEVLYWREFLGRLNRP